MIEGALLLGAEIKRLAEPLQEAIGRPMVEIFRTRDSANAESLETTTEVAILQIRSMHMPSSSVLICRDGAMVVVDCVSGTVLLLICVGSPGGKTSGEISWCSKFCPQTIFLKIDGYKEYY